MKKTMLLFLAFVLAFAFVAAAYGGTKFGNGEASQATTASYVNWTGVSGTEQFSSAGTMTNVVLDDNGNVISSTTGLGDVYRVFGWRYVTVQWKGVYSGWYNYSTASGNDPELQQLHVRVVYAVRKPRAGFLRNARWRQQLALRR
jgi:hypothetical protein